MLSRGLTPLTVAICAYFVAQGAGKLAVAQLRLPAIASQSEGGQTVQDLAQAPAQSEPIIQRNIFCSSCERAASTPTMTQASTPLVKAELFATVIPEQGASQAYAALYQAGPVGWRLVAAGDELEPGVKVDLVTSTGIVVTRNGQQQLIPLLGQVPDEDPADHSPKAERTATIQQTGETSFTIQRRALLRELRRLGLELARGKGELPIRQEAEGLRVTGKGPAGLVDRLGLRQGDLVQSINQRQLHTLQDTVGLYSQLMHANQLTLRFRRENQLVTFLYTIR